MRKNKLLIVITIIFIFLSSVCALYIISNNDNILYEEYDVKKNDNLFAMMVETDAKSGIYNESTSNEWLTDGYVFNSELSGCENGGELSWDDVNKKVIMEGSSQDKCYVYFKVYVEPVVALSDYVISQYTGVQGENGLYYHDSNLENGAGDNSYRYAGANPNNYVCFGSDASTCPADNLYRIIGVFDGRVKLIKADYATSTLLGIDGDYEAAYSDSTTNYKGSLSTSNIGGYMWNYNGLSDKTINNGNGSNTWSTSLLNKTNLNKNFITNIGVEWANMIDITIWKVGGNTWSNIGEQPAKTAYQNEILNPVITNSTDNKTEYSAKIGLMYASDYGFAAAPSAWTTNLYDYDGGAIKNVNWMYMGLFEWTISRTADDLHSMFDVYNAGGVLTGYAVVAYGVRPVFFLTLSVNYSSGSGTSSDPIRISL